MKTNMYIATAGWVLLTLLLLKLTYDAGVQRSSIECEQERTELLERLEKLGECKRENREELKNILADAFSKGYVQGRLDAEEAMD